MDQSFFVGDSKSKFHFFLNNFSDNALLFDPHKSSLSDIMNHKYKLLKLNIRKYSLRYNLKNSFEQSEFTYYFVI